MEKQKDWYNKLIDMFLERNVSFCFDDWKGREVSIINQFAEEAIKQAKQEVFDGIDKFGKAYLTSEQIDFIIKEIKKNT